MLLPRTLLLPDFVRAFRMKVQFPSKAKANTAPGCFSDSVALFSFVNEAHRPAVEAL